MFNIKNANSAILNIFFVISGTLMLSFASAVFIIPFNLVAGGVSGIAIIVSNLFGGKIPVESIIAVVTWSLFAVSFIFLGKSFALKTLISTIVYPVGVAFFSLLITQKTFNGFFCIADSVHGDVAILPAAILSGVLIGTGCSLTFLGGGSSGGIDVIAFLLCKKIRKLRHSTAIFYIDAVIIVMGMFVIKDLVLSIFGVSCVLITAIAIDKIFLGESRAFIAHIISKEHDKINKMIIERLNRTTTMVEVVGGYSGKCGKMLVLSFNMAQYRELMSIIADADKNAFVTTHRAHEINGEGWR